MSLKVFSKCVLAAIIILVQFGLLCCVLFRLSCIGGSANFSITFCCQLSNAYYSEWKTPGKLSIIVNFLFFLDIIKGNKIAE